MQNRDVLKDNSYFKRVIHNMKELDSKSILKLENGEVPIDRVKDLKISIAESYLYTLIAEYSAGYDRKELLIEYGKSLNLLHQSWAGHCKLKNIKGQDYDQYTLSPYDEMLWMLSLGYLLNVPNEEYKKLVSVIDQDKVKDKLYEFIISAKLKDRAPLMEESYREYFGVPQVFATLRLAIEQQNKKEAERLVKLFLEKEWYKNHKDAGWYNTHKSKHDVYVGYWCFESAAVVKIMGLDDSNFRDNKYYPKDLL